MQGVLAHAKNDDELFWEEKFHAANVKAQARSQSALLFFPFKVEVGGKSMFLLFISLIDQLSIFKCFPPSDTHWASWENNENIF